MSKFFYSGIVVENKIVARYNRVENLANSKTSNGEKREYCFTNSSRRSVKSKCAYLATRGFPSYFITLTFVQELEGNKVITRFIDNLKKRGLLKSYVWVKERGEKGGRLHYHLLFNSENHLFSNGGNYCKASFIRDKDIFQAAWNSAQRNLGGGVSNNSMRLGRNPNVQHPNKIASYLSKYITKNFEKFECRNYACSNDLKDSVHIIESTVHNLEKFRVNKVYENDFVKFRYYSLSSYLLNEVHQLEKLHDNLVNEYYSM